MSSGSGPDTEVLTFTVDPEAEALPVEYVVRDAENADEWPTDWTRQWEDENIRIHATPAALRWAYDWMEWAEDSYRLEDGKYYADACRQLADRFWDELQPDPPDRQRTRRIIR